MQPTCRQEDEYASLDPGVKNELQPQGPSDDPRYDGSSGREAGVVCEDLFVEMSFRGIFHFAPTRLLSSMNKVANG